MREKLIDALLDLSSDEFEDSKEIIELAKESEEQLLDRLIHIAKYYYEQY